MIILEMIIVIQKNIDNIYYGEFKVNNRWILSIFDIIFTIMINLENDSKHENINKNNNKYMSNNIKIFQSESNLREGQWSAMWKSLYILASPV